MKFYCFPNDNIEKQKKTSGDSKLAFLSTSSLHVCLVLNTSEASSTWVPSILLGEMSVFFAYVTIKDVF